MDLLFLLDEVLSSGGKGGKAGAHGSGGEGGTGGKGGAPCAWSAN